MKELIIQIKIDKHQTATVIKRQGFEESVSSNYEVIGILENLIRIEQDKMTKNSTTVTNSQSENGSKK